MKKYFRYKRDKHIYTENNWADSLISNTIDVTQYELEMNEDIKAEHKLRHEIGDEQANLIIAEYRKIRELLLSIKAFNDIGTGYGHAFEVFALSTLHDLEYEQCIEKHIVIGESDGKTDGVYWDSHNIYLYQFKLNNVNAVDISAMRTNYQEYISRGTISSPNSSDLLCFYNAHHNNVTQNLNIKLMSVSANRSDSNNKTAEDLYLMYFKKLVLPQVKNNIELTIKIDIDTDGNPNIAMLNDLEFFTFKKFVDLKRELVSNDKLARGQKIHKLFYDNVRGHLGKNTSMDKTITNNPRDFSIFNNGISLTGEVEYHHNSAQIVIKNPVIVNGQQTLTNLMQSTEDTSQIYVPLFIKNTLDLNKKREIAKYNNTQSPITNIDLISLSNGVRSLQEQLLSDGVFSPKNSDKYFLDIYSKGTPSYRKTIEKIIKNTKIIKLSEFIKLYYSFVEPEKLGYWKNSISTQLDKKLAENNNELVFDIAIAKQVCKAIEIYNDYVSSLSMAERNKVRVADLIIQFILFKKDFNISESISVKNSLDDDFKLSEPEKGLADLYRRRDIYSKVVAKL